ncbi:MAG TPA: SGNH family hydrolase, partial [Bradyrhizobium sp.]|nr:SGNH family hydrolase [Bradyrhizobium sp.]
MQKPKSFFRIFTEPGPLIALSVAVALLVGLAGPASAQFFNFGGWSRPQPRSSGGSGGWFGGDLFAPFQQQQQAPKRVENFSKAPPPEKRETAPERNVLVLGDAMADWLAYGLEDAYAEQPEIGVIRRHKTVSGLIKYQPKGEPADWAAAAKGILATEKPDAIVVMLGLEDRVPIREPAADKADKKVDKKEARGRPDGKPADKSGTKPDGANDAAAKPDDKPADTDASSDDSADNDAAQTSPPEKSARAPNGIYQFRDDRWVELYTKKIEEMIAVLKSKGVPVLWVGLPAVRGPKATADMLFLDSLYREAAGKAGITYVDVWEGFVDEAGRFLQQGPDFEGQIRRLRSYDGVYFTRPGARKLAHYVEREITRLLGARSAPFALPSEPATPDANAVPGQPAPRPLAGPIVPLVASSVGTDQLLGGPGSRPAAVDALAARTMVKGEALAPPAGRADDFAWPRREVGREQAKGETPIASVSPDGTPAAPSKAKKQAAPVQSSVPASRELFGNGFRKPPSSFPPPRSAPNFLRPPANVGRS